MSEQGNNLDRWYDSYSERTAGLAASEVRALFAVASRPRSPRSPAECRS